MRYLVQALGTLAKTPKQGAGNEVNAAKDYNTVLAVSTKKLKFLKPYKIDL